MKVLLSIVRESDYETTNDVFQALYGNSVTLLTNLGGGIHGHFSIIMNTTLFSTLVLTVYVAPANPGTVPNIPGVVTAA